MSTTRTFDRQDAIDKLTEAEIPLSPQSSPCASMSA
jgi:hypothetical protein